MVEMIAFACAICGLLGLLSGAACRIIGLSKPDYWLMGVGLSLLSTGILMAYSVPGLV